MDITTTFISEPTFRGSPLSGLPGGCGPLEDAGHLRGDPEALRARMERDGYLFLPGLLDRDRVRDARRSILLSLESEGMLDPDAPLDDAVARPGLDLQFRPDLAHGNPAVDQLLYGGEALDRPHPHRPRPRRQGRHDLLDWRNNDEHPPLPRRRHPRHGPERPNDPLRPEIA